MSMREPDFASQVALCTKIHYANPNIAAELAAIATALGSDPTTHDATIEARAAALTIGADKTRFTNDILLLVNAAKGGNLNTSQIISGIDDAVGVAHKPGVIDIPYASAAPYPPASTSTVCSCTNGNWTGVPTSYAYQWKRDGATNLGTAASYTLIAADIGGHQIACVVTATNATGSTTAPPSNAIAT
jgi:hypothetical protein